MLEGCLVFCQMFLDVAFLLKLLNQCLFQPFQCLIEVFFFAIYPLQAQVEWPHHLRACAGIVSTTFQIKPLLVPHLISQALQTDKALSQDIVGPVYIFVGYEDLQLFLAGGDLEGEPFIPDGVIRRLMLVCFYLLTLDGQNYVRFNQWSTCCLSSSKVLGLHNMNS